MPAARRTRPNASRLSRNCGTRHRPIEKVRRAELGHGDLELRQELEQEALELLIRAVNLVDQEHGRARARRIDGLQQRTPDQKTFRVEIMPRVIGVEVCRRLENAELEQLTSVI